MYDIVDSKVSAVKLGMISGQPTRLANEAFKALKKFAGAPMMIFVDEHGALFALPAANATDRSIDEIVGTYSGKVDARDIADDIRASVGSRLAAIGDLVSGDPSFA